MDNSSVDHTRYSVSAKENVSMGRRTKFARA